MAITITVDYDVCQSHGQCMAQCPEVFEVRSDGFMYVLDEHPDESLRGKVEDAAAACPTQAITIEG